MTEYKEWGAPMQATLEVTSMNTGLSDEIQDYITSFAELRALSLLNLTTKDNTLTVQVDGEKLDVYVLTNAIASSFPEVKVKLNQNSQDVLEAP